MTHQSAEVEKVPVIRVSYNVNVSDKSGLIFETYLAQNADEKTINGVVDKLVSVSERQAAHCELAKLLEDIEAVTGQIQRMKDDLSRMDQMSQERWEKSSRKGEFKLSEAEAKARQNVVSTIEGLQGRKKSTEEKLAKHKVLIESRK